MTEDKKTKAYRILQQKIAKRNTMDHIEHNCSKHAREIGSRPGYDGTPLAPIGHRGKYEED